MPEPDKGSFPSTYTLSSGEAAKAELRELREVASEMAQALERVLTAEPEIRRAPVTDERYVSRTAEDVMRDIAAGALARYEAVRDGTA